MVGPEYLKWVANYENGLIEMKDSRVGKFVLYCFNNNYNACSIFVKVFQRVVISQILN